MRTISALGGVSMLATCMMQASAADLPADPWVLLTQRDLQAIHDTLAANHPGPVDPQSDRYRRRLEDGLQVAQAEAARARQYSDYTRALRRYVNGFRDGHTTARFLLSSERVAWPGFLVGRAADEKIRVLAAAADGNVPRGAELVACDGTATEQLVEERLDPYYWNADIPHERWDTLPKLFQFEPIDTTGRMASCTFRIDGAARSIELHWANAPRETVIRYVQDMQPPAPALGLHQREGIWFVALPSFNYFGESTAGITALVDEMTARAAELRAGTVVFDVRGNGGGNSAWAERVASAFWGERAVRRVVESFDWTVDWRVSPDNIAHLNRTVERNERDGLTEAARSWAQARDALVAAQKQNQSLVRVAEAPKASAGPAPKSLVTGRVFLLTDGACASACLDFADVVRRLPHVTHIGLPTSADAVYIDNTESILPSRLAVLSYSLKVYRNRVRANNEWYEPAIRWAGGVMSDEAITAWIRQLAAAPAAPQDSRRRQQ
ncbi:MAG TPA: S41 family peptidase [Steroidobacteraceae bacterium]|nr:S41 family peptidase [Steroidobacteraceae bacterium]